jgi:hypothetical protein
MNRRRNDLLMMSPDYRVTTEFHTPLYDLQKIDVIKKAPGEFPGGLA